MMKTKNILMFIISLAILLVVSVYFNNASPANKAIPSKRDSGQIYLYGESHGVKKILEREFELWYDYYLKKIVILFDKAIFGTE